KEGESGASNVAWGDGNSTWELWWEKISSYIRIDFNAGQDIRPLLAGEQLAQVRLTIGLALEQAQWAALNGKQEVYEQALKQAQDVLDGYFN
ncbi:uroporphyrinogen-III C-methyltransferase, partial [Acinetobacter baumannii]